MVLFMESTLYAGIMALTLLLILLLQLNTLVIMLFGAFRIYFYNLSRVHHFICLVTFMQEQVPHVLNQELHGLLFFFSVFLQTYIVFMGTLGTYVVF